MFLWSRICTTLLFEWPPPPGVSYTYQISKGDPRTPLPCHVMVSGGPIAGFLRTHVETHTKSDQSESTNFKHHAVFHACLLSFVQKHLTSSLGLKNKCFVVLSNFLGVSRGRALWSWYCTHAWPEKCNFHESRLGFKMCLFSRKRVLFDSIRECLGVIFQAPLFQ